MKEKKCKNCGSKDLEFKAGVYVCACCETEYYAEADDQLAKQVFDHFTIENDILIDYYGHDDVVEIPDGITRVVKDVFAFNSLKVLKCPRSVTRFDGSLKRCKELECFEAPGLTNISKEMFHKHGTIKKVVLQSVKEIPNEAFYQCENLEEVVLSNVTAVRENAFADSGLERIAAPKLQIVEENAFNNCVNLESINLPKVLTVGDFAFYGCESLITAKLPNVTDLGESAFADCVNLLEATAPKLKILGESAFESCEKLQKVIAPNLEEIGNYGFRGCKKMESAHFPKLEKMGEQAFRHCFSLKEVECEQASLEPADNGKYYQFLNCTSLVSLKINEAIKKKRIIIKENTSRGCYIATCIYGEYDCPQVWTLRRYRDNVLAENGFGRAFIKVYYAISPALVKWFGTTNWFKNLWRGKLDKMVAKLQASGFEATPYEDKKW